jgi:hypothetical protein
MATPTLQSIAKFIPAGTPLAKAGGAQMLLRAAGGNLMGAAVLAALARKESSFGAQAFVPNNFWGYGIHAGPSVNRAPSVEAMAARVWKGLTDPKGYYAKSKTIGEALNTYAPPSENNTSLYQSQVNQWLAGMGFNPASNFRGGPSVAPGAAPGVPPAPGAPGAADLAPVSGSLDVKRLMGILNATSQRALRGEMPGPNYGKELQRLAAGALPRAQVKAAGQQVGSQAAGAAQAVSGAVGGLSMGGGPSAHHSRALGNWQSDDAYDLMGKAGQAVHAPFAGTVVTISGQPGGDPGFAGYGVTVKDAQGNQYFFKHLGTTRLKPGSRFRQGDLIGTLDAKTAGGPHLHLGGTNSAALSRLAKLYTR